MKKYIALLFILLLPLTSYADGNELLRNCNSALHAIDLGKDVDYGAGMCLGTVSGIDVITRAHNIIAEQNNQPKTFFCAPASVTNAQYIRIIVKYLNDNPAKLHENDAALIVRALGEAFPCK